LNYSVKDLLDNVLKLHKDLKILDYDKKTDVYLVNNDGYYLIHPDREKEWGWMLKRDNFTLAKEKKDLFEKVKIGERACAETSCGLIEYYGFNYHKTDIKEIDENTRLTIISIFSREELKELRIELLRELTLSYLMYLFLSLFISFLYGREKFKEVRYVSQIKELSIKDSLTGAYNKRYLLEFLEKKFEERERHNLMFSCIMFDIDNFKDINDSLGHIKGDKLLKRVADLTLENIRKTDVFARFGGDEFIVILPNIDVGGAIRVAEKIRYLVENDEDFDVSITIGIVGNKEEDSFEEMLIRMDKALYTGKKLGKNRVYYKNKAKEFGEEDSEE